MLLGRMDGLEKLLYIRIDRYSLLILYNADVIMHKHNSLLASCWKSSPKFAFLTQWQVKGKDGRNEIFKSILLAGLWRIFLHTSFTLTGSPERRGLRVGIMSYNFMGLYQWYVTLYDVQEVIKMSFLPYVIYGPPPTYSWHLACNHSIAEWLSKV